MQRDDHRFRWHDFHFMTCRHHDGRGCSLGLYGGRPSPGVCALCDRYDGPARGLGDRIAAVAEVTGVAAVARTVERVTGRPCGCAERRRALNEAFPTSYPQAKSESAPKVAPPSEPM